MSRRLSRRQFVAAVAVGVAISPSPKAADPSPPIILVKPYLQPGDGGTFGKADVKVLCWLTDQKPGEFIVEYEVAGNRPRTVRPERIVLDFEKAPEPKKVVEEKPKDSATPPAENTGKLPPEREQHYFKYVARLNDLPFDADVRYRVRHANAVIREGSFRTRASAEKPVRLVMVGDLANGRDHQNAIAYRIGEEKPDFLVALGDIAYPGGRVSHYMNFFWKTCNDVETPHPSRGAPLMASLPVYPVLGNHDVLAKFPTIPDALGAYYFFHPPQNGPGAGPWASPLGSDKAAVARFHAATRDSYPAIDAYSFDYGPAHIVVLKSNMSGNVDQPKLRQWVETDLKGSSARWKFVCYHNPAFSSSHQHYTEQSVRGWHPLFEACGVDMVFCGHVHNYQRTRPVKFTLTAAKRDKRGRLDGAFVLDSDFDGKTNTRPRGIVHIVAGGGGATLYGPGLEKTALTLKQEHGDNYTDFTARMAADRHSFVVVDLTPETFRLRAIDLHGQTFDQFAITKPAK
jgi:acid phosphatase type 7